MIKLTKLAESFLVGIVSQNAFGPKPTQESIYSITAGGLKALDTSVEIYPNSVYFLGASSSPDRIIVTKVDSKWITYRKYPYESDLKIEASIGKDLIVTGTNTWLKSAMSKYHPAVAATLKKNLEGRKGPENGKHPVKDYERIEVGLTISHADPYGYAKQFGVITGHVDQEAGYIEITTDRRTLRDEIKKDRNVTSHKEL